MATEPLSQASGVEPHRSTDTTYPYTPDDLLVLTAVDPAGGPAPYLTKQFIWRADGSRTERSYDLATWYTHRVHRVTTLAQMQALLEHLRHDPHSCLVQGLPILEPWTTSPIQRRKKGGTHPTIYAERWTQWLILDADSVPVEVDWRSSPEEVGQAILETWQVPELSAAQCVVMLTGSHGLKPGARARLVFRLETPQLLSTLARWARWRKKVAAPELDAATFSANQPIYTATPRHLSEGGEALQDVLPRRIGLLASPSNEGVKQRPGEAGVQGGRDLAADGKGIETRSNDISPVTPASGEAHPPGGYPLPGVVRIPPLPVEYQLRAAHAANANGGDFQHAVVRTWNAERPLAEVLEEHGYGFSHFEGDGEERWRWLEDPDVAPGVKVNPAAGKAWSFYDGDPLHEPGEDGIQRPCDSFDVMRLCGPARGDWGAAFRQAEAELGLIRSPDEVFTSLVGQELLRAGSGGTRWGEGEGESGAGSALATQTPVELLLNAIGRVTPGNTAHVREVLTALAQGHFDPLDTQLVLDSLKHQAGTSMKALRDMLRSLRKSASKNAGGRGVGLVGPEVGSLGDVSTETSSAIVGVGPVELENVDPMQPVPWDKFPDVKLSLEGHPEALLPTIQNLEVLLQHYGIRLQMDAYTKQPLAHFPWADYHGDSDGEADDILAQISSLAARTQMSRERIDNYVGQVCRKSPRNFVAEYLLQLPQWDGVDRIAELTTCLEVPERHEHARNISVFRWLVQAVAAADGLVHCPRTDALVKFEYVLVMLSDQGRGKGKWLRWLIPNELRRYYKEGVTLDPADKDSVMRATGRWIVELGEIDATFRKADLARIKAFLSEEHDEYRVPYGRAISRWQRRSVYAGTVNSVDFLADPTGARRFLAFELQMIDPRYLQIDVRQLWAQAWAYYLQGAQWWPLEEEEVVLERARVEFEGATEHPAVARVLAAFGPFTPQRTDMTRWWTMTEILAAAGVIRPTQSDMLHVSRWLTRHHRTESGHRQNSMQYGLRHWRMPIPKPDTPFS